MIVLHESKRGETMIFQPKGVVCRERNNLLVYKGKIFEKLAQIFQRMDRGLENEEEYTRARGT